MEGEIATRAKLATVYCIDALGPHWGPPSNAATFKMKGPAASVLDGEPAPNSARCKEFREN